ncbi:MAG: signal recognition particle-docking protein FtsY [Bdellovibrionaceae bacterium]|nr:signal recognition particle-docking protein FtsY [Pseudobdellovibrionaceae bacterium]
MDLLFNSPELLIILTVLIIGVFGAFLFFRKKKKREPLRETSKERELKALKEEVSQREVRKLVSLEDALKNTQKNFWGRIGEKLSGKSFSPSDLEDIEEVLYTSDLGPKTVQKLFSSIENKMSDISGADNLRSVLRNEILGIFKNVESGSSDLALRPDGPTVWMVVGVNGAGKTTTIGKLAAKMSEQGKKVLIAAGDTFRAAADAQLKVWSERANVDIYSPENIKDPSAIAFDACTKGKAGQYDLVIVDTAGRLHTQKNLMEELKKIKRVMAKVESTAPHEVLLVLDANSGQNALMQAQEFHEALGVTGVIITKMDGSAKGGVAVGVACDVGLPVKMIGVGESVEDLRPFSPQDFVTSII